MTSGKLKGLYDIALVNFFPGLGIKITSQIFEFMSKLRQTYINEDGTKWKEACRVCVKDVA